MTYRPLGSPLIPGYASPATQNCVVIPARNEERTLYRTLDALRLQVDLEGHPLDPATYEVIVFLNNCTDSSQSVAEQYQRTHPDFALHVASRYLSNEEAHVGTARRLLMDTAYHRLRNSKDPHCAILSTDADTVVDPDWVARNTASIQAGADVVGGLICLLPEDISALQQDEPGTYLAYDRDRELQALVAQLESILDPDPADPWPRHLQHFGASLACTRSIYAIAGGLPPAKVLEDVAFIGALRNVDAHIRHCPLTSISTSGRLNGRIQVGLSGQLRYWQSQCHNRESHIVDSASWMKHRFRSLRNLRRINRSHLLPPINGYPEHWQSRIKALHASRLPTGAFLQQLDCDTLIEELFVGTRCPRHSLISEVISDLRVTIGSLAGSGRTQSLQFAE